MLNSKKPLMVLKQEDDNDIKAAAMKCVIYRNMERTLDKILIGK